jgi:diphthine synthase
MNHLIFIGLGLSGVDGMTVRAFNALRGCDVIFAEFYTSALIGASVKDLEDAAGKKINVLRRAQVEEDDVIIEAARTSRVGFVTAGDTMAATTHVDLLIQAAEEGIPTKVFHGVSVFSACPASLGLQPYKFGRTVTLPFIEPGYHPRSPYDHLVANKKEGLHSMVLLDIRADENRYMTAHEAIEWLLEGERKWKCGLVTCETLICAASKIGSDEERVFAGYPDDLLKKDLGGPLHTLVIPGQLHFMESYALVHLAGAPASLIKDDD